MANVVEIVIKQSGQGNAISATIKELGGLDKAASSSIGALGRFGSALGGMATVAGGIVVANVFGKIADGISSMIATGLQAVGSSQQLETSLKSLLTANNMYTQTTERVTVAVGNLAEMQAEAADKADDLAFKQRKLTADIATQNATIQEQRQRIIQMADGLDKNQQVARLAEMEVALEGMNRELADTVTEQGKLNNITQEYTTVSKQTWQQVMSQADAFELAKEQTKDLIDFVSRLAVISPFETETVEQTTKYAIAAGMSIDATKEFIPAFLDLAAAVGITSTNLEFVADQFFQVKKVGKLLQPDLKQLRTRGLDLAKILEIEMKMSVEEFNAEAAKSPEIFDELFAAVTRFSQNTFSGTSKDMALSVKGLQSAVSDIFVIGSRTFMRPLVDAVTPAIAQMIGKISDFVLGGDLESIGQQFADKIAGWMGMAQGAAEKVMGAFERFGVRGAGVSILGMLGLDPEQIASVMGVADQITEVIDKITGAFERFGLKGAAVSILGQLGIDPETIKTITDVTTKVGEILALVASFGGFGLTGFLFVPPDPALIEGITAITDEVLRLKEVFTSGFETGGLGGGLSALFGDIQPQLQNLAGQILAGIPTFLTTITDAIAAFFRDNWPTIMTSLNEWAAKFWEWTNTALAGAGTALAGVLLAISAWSTSSEAQTSLNNMGQELGKALQQGITFLFENSGEAALVLLKIVGALAAAVATIAGNLIIIGGQIVAGMVAGMLEELGVNVQPALVSELQGILIGIAENSMTIIREIAKKIARALGEGIRTALDSEIVKAFTNLVTLIRGEVGEVLDYLTSDLLPLLEKGFERVTEGVRKFISSLKETATTLADMVIPDFLQQHSPPPLATAFNMVAAGATNAQKAVAGMQQSLVGSSENVGRFIDSLNMGNLARGFGGGGSGWKEMRRVISNGITANFGTLMAGGDPGAIFGHIQQVAQRFRFPPSLASEFAKINGLVETMTDKFREFRRQVIIENLDNMTQMAGQFSGLGQTFADMLAAQMGDSKAAEEALKKLADSTTKLTEGNTKLTGELDNQKKQLEIYQKELANLNAEEEKDLLAIEKKTLQIDKLTEAMDKNRATIEANKQAIIDNQKALTATQFSMATGNQAEQIAFLQAFLESGEETVRLIGEELGGVFAGSGLTSDVFWDRVSAQDELNRLLEEQRRQEELITAQKEAQQKLDFLRSQLDLLKLGQQLGGNIFQGITFGLNASVEDLLAATNAVTQAMVDQIDADLQIASPSRVLFKKFRDQVGGAMVGGLLAVKPMLDRVVSPMLEPLTGESSSRVTNNYFNQTVNTRAESSTVIGDFRTMQLMAGS